MKHGVLKFEFSPYRDVTLGGMASRREPGRHAKWLHQTCSPACRRESMPPSREEVGLVSGCDRMCVDVS